MQDLVTLLPAVGNALGALLNGRRRERQEVADLFHALAKVFGAFPAAKAAQDVMEMQRLAAETKGILAGLQGNAGFKRVLGDKAEPFLSDIAKVANAKTLLAKDAAAVGQLTLIVSAAGFFEGYAKTLDTAREAVK